MTDPMDPTETYDGRIMVHLLRDSQDNQEIPCSSFREAISVVKDKRHLATVSKIVDRDDEVVFSSADVDIEAWERVWKNEKRRLSVTVEEYDCPTTVSRVLSMIFVYSVRWIKFRTVPGSLVSSFLGAQVRATVKKVVE